MPLPGGPRRTLLRSWWRCTSSGLLGTEMLRTCRSEIVPAAPLKWRKYLTLIDFGFVSEDELAADIRRYRISRVHRIVSYIASDLRYDSRRARCSFYVVKLVPADLPGQLPNFVIERTSQLKQLVAFLAARMAGNYLEAWYCRTRIDPRVFSVAGRIVFTTAEGGR